MVKMRNEERKIELDCTRLRKMTEKNRNANLKRKE